jgi:hypothetical protein
VLRSSRYLTDDQAFGPREHVDELGKSWAASISRLGPSSAGSCDSAAINAGGRLTKLPALENLPARGRR